MAASSDIQLLPVVKDLQASIQELSECHGKDQQPVTDGNPTLHRLCTKLEYLLQYDQKEKKSILGARKDYWDYFCVCLNGHKCGTDVLKFVHGTLKLGTSLGRGRAFIRYCLVQQQLADSLQFCFHNQKLVSDWYYARSPFRSDSLRSDIMEQLYALNEITFDLALIGVDLDTSWPVARWETKHRRSCRTSPTQASEGNESAQGIHGPPGESGADTDKFKTSTRISRTDPSISSFKGMDKNASKDPAEGRRSGNQVVTKGVIESRKTDVEGEPSGASETPLASGNDGPPVVSQQETSVESGPAQTKHDVGASLHEGRTVGLDKVSNSPSQNLEGSHVGRPGKDQEVVTILTVGEQRGEQLSMETEQRALIKFQRELQEKEGIIEELQDLLAEKEKINVEECAKHQREVASLKEMQEERVEKLNRLEQLEDSNKFLNETVEEMDSILDGLRQALAAKTQEDILLRKEQMEKMAAAEQVHREEMEKLMIELGEVRGEMERDGDPGSKESIPALVRSGRELEAEERSEEVENLQCKLQQLESLNNSLEDRYQRSLRQIRDLEMSVESLQSEVSRLQGSEQQTWEPILPPDRTPGEVDKNLEGNTRMVQLKSEPLSQQPDRDELEQGKTLLLDSLAALKQENQQAQENISDLSQQLARYREREMTPKENTNTTAKNNRDLNILKDKLEEIILSLESPSEEKLAIEEKLEEVLAQLHELTAEQSNPGKWAVQSKDQHEVLAEEKTHEVLAEEKTHEVLAEEKTHEVLAEEEKTKLPPLEAKDIEVGYGLHAVSSENGSTQRKLVSALSTPDESARGAAEVKEQMGELGDSAGQTVQRMEERIESLKAETETLECQKEDLEKKVSALEEDLWQLKHTVGKLELDSSKALRELPKAQEMVEELRAQSACLATNVGLEQAAERVEQRQQEGTVGRMEADVEQLPPLTQEEGVWGLLTDQEHTSRPGQTLAQGCTQFQQEGVKHMAAQGDSQTDGTEVGVTAGERRSEDAELQSLASSLAQAKVVENELKETLAKTQENAKTRAEESDREIQDLKEMVVSLKERTVQLLREKDLLWQKAENLEFNPPLVKPKTSLRRSQLGSKKGI